MRCRRGRPGTALADDATKPDLRAKLQAVLRLEEQGSEVLPIAADVSEESGARLAVSAALARFGRIDGSYRGRDRRRRIDPARPRELSKRCWPPKISGVLALESACLVSSWIFWRYVRP